VVNLARPAVTAIFLACGSGCGALVGLGDPRVFDPDASDVGADAADDGSVVARPLTPLRIAVGASHACATVFDAPTSPENGSVRCWGSNASGELGVDPAKVSLSARSVEVSGRRAPSLRSAVELGLGAGASCATVDGFLECWGAVPGESAPGVHREASDPAFLPSTVDLRDGPLLAVTAASLGPFGGCAVVDGQVACWGGDDFVPDAGSVHLDGGVAVSSFAAAAVGRAHACGLTARKDVMCWGDNARGQLGAALTTASSKSPLRVSLGGADVIASGGDTACALAGGGVYCWGGNDRGQAGDPSLHDTANPVAIDLSAAGSAKPTAIAMGDAHACAAMSDGSVWCWGDDARGQLGQGAGGAALSATPRKVQKVLSGAQSALARVEHLAAGGGTNCAILWADTNVWCWGANDRGQAGQPPSAAVTEARPLGL